MKKFFTGEYSKRLLYWVWALILMLLIPSFIISVMCDDVSPMREYVIGAFSLASISHGFYYWKAKNENLHKYGKDDEIKHE